MGLLGLGDRADGGVSRDGHGGDDGRVSRAVGDCRSTAGDGDLLGGVDGRSGPGTVAGGSRLSNAGKGAGGHREDCDGVLHFDFVGRN